jgi:anti-sigma factor RsiW
MKKECTKWNEALLEATLTGNVADEVREHLAACGACSEQFAALRARRERMDALLPLVAQGAEPSPEFRARVLVAAEAADKARRTPGWLAWGLATVAALAIAAALTSIALHSRSAGSVPAAEIAAAEKFSQWRAPSDVFLETPGRELLQTTPKLGGSYLQVPAKMEKEK